MPIERKFRVVIAAINRSYNINICQYSPRTDLIGNKMLLERERGAIGTI
jgi:hypothetical protein